MHKIDNAEEMSQAFARASGKGVRSGADLWREIKARVPAISPYRQVLVELRNRAHLASAYGAAVADEVLSQLQLRALCLGGEVWALDSATLLVNVPDELDADEAGRDDASPVLDELMEHWQLWLSTAVTTKDAGLRVLPVVGLSRAFRAEASGDRRDGASSLSPWALELNPLDDVQFLPPAGRGAQWRDAYMQDMAVAINLHDRLALGDLSLEFQPIVHADDHSEVLYLEALLRLTSPEVKQPSTSMGGAIPALERLGLVRELDRVVVLSLVRWLGAHPLVRVGCNVSALSLVNDSWWVSIISRLKSRPDVAGRITFEITETAAHYDSVVAAEFARRLQALGCQIALDDFGTGYTSFAFMQSVRPEVAKLDGSLIRAARASSSGEKLLASVTAFCRSIAGHVVAEGVEDPGDVDCASRAGADCVQGYAVGVPAPMNPRFTLSNGDDFLGWVR